ncbi:MAG TPA: FtsX-like permease family protein [Turneriella sp.]|nr:FtsX-like permease family protein [Turneriella sp.]
MSRLKLLIEFALRNLMRQKRRNALLGVAIAFGTMILIVANSFSRGITDTLLNKVVVRLTGHIELAISERSRPQNLIIRDKAKYLDLLKKNIPEIREVRENIGILARAIGNGKGENAMIYPMDLGDGSDFKNHIDTDYLLSRTESGNIEDILSTRYENPVAIFADKAKALRVNLLDTLKVRLKTITGQEQSARFTVVMLLKSTSFFESNAILVPLKNLKTLRGLRANETGALQVVLNKITSPEAVKKLADKIHTLFHPGIAALHGQLVAHSKETRITIAGLTQEYKKNPLVTQSISLTEGEYPRDNATDTMMLSAQMAKFLDVSVGDSVTLRFKTIHQTNDAERNFIVAGIFSKPPFTDVGAFLPEAAFYKTWLEDFPEKPLLYEKSIPAEWKNLLAPEFRLLPRTANLDELVKKQQGLRKTNFYGPAIDVRTMYETASHALELEKVLNLITFIAVLVIFFIILIGVVNTLRMTIRERTREIGTMRAIGVYAKDVRNIFILETLLLTLIASVVGLTLALLAMLSLSWITIDTQSALGILLDKKHLYFVPHALDILRNIFVILVIAAVTAYFPSRRAAQLDPAAALRSYE